MVFFAILSGYESVRIPVHGWFRCGPEALPVGSGGFVNQLGPGWKWKKLILVGDKLINYLSSGPRSTIAYGKNVYYKSFSPHSQLISRHCLNCFKRKKKTRKIHREKSTLQAYKPFPSHPQFAVIQFHRQRHVIQSPLLEARTAGER